MNMKYLIRKETLDSYSSEFDKMEDFLQIECEESKAMHIIYSLSISEADYGNPYVSYYLFDSEGNKIQYKHNI